MHSERINFVRVNSQLPQLTDDTVFLYGPEILNLVNRLVDCIQSHVIVIVSSPSICPVVCLKNWSANTPSLLFLIAPPYCWFKFHIKPLFTFHKRDQNWLAGVLLDTSTFLRIFFFTKFDFCCSTYCRPFDVKTLASRPNPLWTLLVSPRRHGWWPPCLGQSWQFRCH